MKPTVKGGAVRTEPQNDEIDVDAPGEGAEDRSGSAEERLSGREALFAAIDAKRNAAVQEDIDYAFETGDPAAAQAEAARRTRQAEKDKEPKVVKTEGEQDSAADSGDKQDVVEPAGVEAGSATDGAPADEADPLADFIVVQNGKPAMKLKVDGKEKLVPLEAARAQLQKGDAAEVRLQQAAELRKSLAAKEADLNAREAKLKSQPSVPPAAADDKDLDAEVQGVVDSLFTDNAAVAATKLKSVLVKVRQAATPSVDEATIRNVAVQATRQTLAEDSAKTNLVTGLKKFQTEYSDIAKDPQLERIADGMTTTIAEEHPEWSPEQVMLEAGKKTREWLQSLTGTAPAPKPNLAEERRDRKVNLRPLPAQRSVRPSPAAKTAVVETPQSIVAEMRKARGQA